MPPNPQCGSHSGTQRLLDYDSDHWKPGPAEHFQIQWRQGHPKSLKLCKFVAKPISLRLFRTNFRRLFQKSNINSELQIMKENPQSFIFCQYLLSFGLHDFKKVKENKSHWSKYKGQLKNDDIVDIYIEFRKSTSKSIKAPKFLNGPLRPYHSDRISWFWFHSTTLTAPGQPEVSREAKSFTEFDFGSLVR